MQRAGLEVVLAGRYDDDGPGSPWRVALYLDERAHPDQHAAPTDTFIGRAGGTTLTNFAKAIGEVYRVRPAQIRLNHDSGGQRIGVDEPRTGTCVGTRRGRRTRRVRQTRVRSSGRGVSMRGDARR